MKRKVYKPFRATFEISDHRHRAWSRIIVHVDPYPVSITKPDLKSLIL